MAASFLLEITISSSISSAAAPGSSPGLSAVPRGGRGNGIWHKLCYHHLLLSVLPCSSAVGAHSHISEAEPQRMHLMAKLHVKHILRQRYSWYLPNSSGATTRGDGCISPLRGSSRAAKAQGRCQAAAQ